MGQCGHSLVDVPFHRRITPSRLRKHTVGTPEFHWSARLGQQEYITQDCRARRVRVRGQKFEVFRTSNPERRTSECAFLDYLAAYAPRSVALAGFFQHPALPKSLSCRRLIPDRSSPLSTQTVEQVGSGTISDYDVFVTYINQLAILRSGYCRPLFRVTPLEQMGRQLVR
jgi:hypothetical protein